MSLIESVQQSVSDMQCKGCYKYYVSNTGLLQHMQRSPMCAKWISILEEDNKFSKDIQEMYSVSNNKIHGNTCGSCGTVYSNLGNLNKHLENSVVCKKIVEHEKQLMYKKLDEMQGLGNIGPADDPIREKHVSIPEASKSKIVHIIWNVFLTDKTQVKDLDYEIKMNNIGYIICILPNKNIYKTIKPSVEIEHCVIEYEDHNPIITKVMSEKFEECYDKIEHFQKQRKNTLVFCNSGYQRSLPFICKYLTSRHNDEIQNIDKALDIVLFQTDKENYLSTKPFIKENLLMLKKDDMTSFL